MGEDDLSYWGLLKKNKQIRLLMTSYLITICGEWLTYIASIDFLEQQLTRTANFSATAISVLVIVRLIPSVVLSIVGGAMADAYDRRDLMVVLNTTGAITSLLFILAYNIESTSLIYIATFIQQCIGGLYEPPANSMIPLLVKNEKELKKAVMLQGLVSGSMIAFGAAASGIIVDTLGSKACFIIDGAAWTISALLVWQIEGNYNVASTESQRQESIWENFMSMIVDGTKYLSSSYFGALVFMKCTSALAFGACDILNVAFSEQDDSNGSSKDAKLGILFAVIGVGAVIGPLVAEPFIDVRLPKTIQLSCVIAFAVSTFGYSGWSLETPYWSICSFALIRSAGSSVIWISSTLLLQQFSSHDMMGRVLAADYALSLLTEALSAYYSGVLMDHADLTANEVSAVLTWTTLGMTIFWGTYHHLGYGAGRYKFKADIISRQQQIDPEWDHGLELERNSLMENEMQ